MPSLAELAAIALLLQTGAPEEPQGAGPRGSSQPTTGEQRFDAIGYADIGEGAGITVSAPGLPGGFAEVTSVDTGKTIVAIVEAGAPPAGRIALLSRGSAQALGLTGSIGGIRVRPINPPGPEIAGLRAGQANIRADAPPALIAALKRKLGPSPVVAAAPKPPVVAKPRPRPAAVVKPRVPAPVQVAAKLVAPTPLPPAVPATAPALAMLTPGFYVQYAALSSQQRAAVLAQTVNGVVEQTDAVYRVHRGPFASDAEAKRERTRAVGLGYRDAQIVRIIP